MTPKAATVSGQLRRAGFRPLPSGTPHTREGLRVKQGATAVFVVLDLDSPQAALVAKGDVGACLEELGYVVYSTAGSRVLRVQLNPDPPYAEEAS